MKRLPIVLLVLFLSACATSRNPKLKSAVLLADREAPLGWVYVRLFADQTFEFESRGLFTGTIYPGRYTVSGDTVFFNYSDSAPTAGSIAVITNKHLAFINGTYPERVEIKLNTLPDNSSFKPE